MQVNAISKINDMFYYRNDNWFGSWLNAAKNKVFAAIKLLIEFKKPS